MDTKSSAILGVCLIIAALIVVLVPRPQMGRYQMHGVPGHAYVIDTATGQVWGDFATPSDPDFKKPKVK